MMLKVRRVVLLIEGKEAGQNFLTKLKGCEPPKVPLDQSSRIPILYMLYDSNIVTPRGSARVFDFKVFKVSTIEADTYLGHHRRSLGDRQRMLNSTNEGTIKAAYTAPYWFRLVLHSLTWAPDRATSRCCVFAASCVLHRIVVSDILK